MSDFLNGLAERFSHNQHNGKEEAEKVTDEMLGISKGHRKSKNPGTGSGGPKDTE